jgi:ABC-2 type transport system ATP-binding protein
MSDSAISVKNLVKRYRSAKVNAVDDISFSVSPGEFFSLLGPNGAGKTTTISILTTTLLPTAGEITIAGHDLKTQSSQVRTNIGIIFQNPSLDLKLTAEENIRLHTALYSIHPFQPLYSLMPKAYKDQVNSLADILGLSAQDMTKPVANLSGGMKRKLEIIRSLMHKPKILFLDEPTSGLDPKSRRDLWHYLDSVRKTHGTTIFLTTHYLEEAENSDRVCILNHGKIAAMGTPNQLKKSYQLKKATLEEVYLKIIQQD